MSVNFTTLRESTYTQLGKLVTSGAVSEAALRNFYRTERRKAQSRISKLKSEKVTREYGKQDIPKFMQEKNLTSMSALLHEIADLNRFLNRKTSLVSGLKKQKEARIKELKKFGVNVDSNSYSDWAEFIQWFNLSEYSKRFEYESTEVKDVFSEAMKQEKSTPAEWEKLFQQYVEHENTQSKRRSYR